MQISKDLLRKEALSFGQRVQNDPSFPYKAEVEKENRCYLDRLEKAEGNTYEEIASNAAKLKETLSKKAKDLNKIGIAAWAVGFGLAIVGGGALPLMAGIIGGMFALRASDDKKAEAKELEKFQSQLENWKQTVEATQKPPQQAQPQASSAKAA